MSNSLSERREQDAACIDVYTGDIVWKMSNEPCQIFHYRYQNIDIYDSITM